jgi:hypothetical protein
MSCVPAATSLTSKSRPCCFLNLSALLPRASGVIQPAFYFDSRFVAVDVAGEYFAEKQI